MSVPCPKCGRSLDPCGEVESDEPSLAGEVYQCPECVQSVDFAGETTELALTFMLDERGRPYDPADPDADLSKD